MGVSKATILFLVGSLSSIVPVGSTDPLSQAEKCDLLDNALGQFLANKQDPDTLYMAFGLYLYPHDSDMASLVRSSKLDFLESTSERHQLACKLVGANNREDISKILGVQMNVVNNYYTKIKTPVQDIGSVKKMEEVAKVLMVLFLWADNTGYPTLPLRNLNEIRTVKIFWVIKQAMMSQHVHRYLVNTPFPLKVSPEDALKALKESKTYEEFERAVHLTPGSMEEFADLIKITPGGAKARKENLKATMKFVKVLDQTGLLNLD